MPATRPLNSVHRRLLKSPLMATAVTARDLIDRLAEHRTLGTAPRTELEWLVAHGSVRKLDVDEVLSAKGRPVAALYIILSGRLALFIDRGSGPNKFVEWHGGDITGMLPYSRMVSPPGDVGAAVGGA